MGSLPETLQLTGREELFRRNLNWMQCSSKFTRAIILVVLWAFWVRDDNECCDLFAEKIEIKKVPVFRVKFQQWSIVVSEWHTQRHNHHEFTTSPICQIQYIAETLDCTVPALLAKRHFKPQHIVRVQEVQYSLQVGTWLRSDLRQKLLEDEARQ